MSIKLMVKIIGNCLWCLLLTASVVAEDGVPITTTQVVKRPLIVKTAVQGVLESPSIPRVAAETGGRIIQIAVDEGDSVKSGQLLAKLDPEIYQINLESASADVQRINALINNQQLTLKRYQNLVARQSSAQSELDTAQTTLAVSLAELAKVKAHIKEIQYQLAKTDILSPVTGFVQQRLVSVGDYVQTETTLFQMVATQQLLARLYLPETLVNQVQLGLAVQLATVAKEQTINAKVSRLRPMLNPIDRALEVLVEFDNVHYWKAGTRVTATLILETRENVLLIPERCIVQRPAGQVVYVIDKDQAQQRVVETGKRDGEWLEIISGLTVGEVIVLDGASFLTDRAKIKEQQP